MHYSVCKPQSLEVEAHEACPVTLEALRREVLREALELLVIEQEALALADARIVEHARHAEWIRLLPLAVLAVVPAVAWFVEGSGDGALGFCV